MFEGGFLEGPCYWVFVFSPRQAKKEGGVGVFGGGRPAYSQLLQGMFEAGYGKALGHGLSILTSSQPKQEVVLGLLAARDSAPSPATASAPLVGEIVTLTKGSTQRQLQVHDSLPSSD